MALRDILVSFNVVVNQQQLLDTQKNVSKLISQFNGLARIAQFALAAIGVGKLTDAADEYIGMENKLKAVTNSTEEFVTAQRGVERIADDLMQPVSDITDAYLRYSLATESLGESQENVLDFTKRVTQAMILSGATAEEAHRAAVQLAQGFGKNFKAAAQDLKSVKEQAPVLARIIEKAAGALPGQLLVAAKAGKVTSRLVFDAVREAGEELDRDFTKRQKRFEDVGNLLGNQWMRLVKLLKPAFVPIINLLESIVHWIAEWVKDGSAMNTVIAGTIMALGTLTYLFGGLALSVAAAAAPFIGLFLILEDLVGFIRGDESVLGDFLNNFLGEEKTAKLRQSLEDAAKAVKDFVAAIFGDNPAVFNQAADHLQNAMTRAFRNSVDAFLKYLLTPITMPAGWLLKKFGIDGDTQPDVLTDADKKRQARLPKLDSEGNPLGAGALPSLHPDANQVSQLLLPGGIPTLPAPVLSGTNTAPITSVGNAAPVITNNITVNGNADGGVARDIATRTGQATTTSLDRDRSAIGAALGMAQ